MQTFFGSVKNRKASNPPSLPTPEFFRHQKERVRKSLNIQQFAGNAGIQCEGRVSYSMSPIQI
ncbi:MAG: hypothetical protein R2784_06045 [Saprospiraceae bacterium]